MRILRSTLEMDRGEIVKRLFYHDIMDCSMEEGTIQSRECFATGEECSRGFVG